MYTAYFADERWTKKYHKGICIDYLDTLFVPTALDFVNSNKKQFRVGRPSKKTHTHTTSKPMLLWGTYRKKLDKNHPNWKNTRSNIQVKITSKDIFMLFLGWKGQKKAFKIIFWFEHHVWKNICFHM